ncbi:alpha/beta-hydrolase [Aspergillus affinis]|uniref:alpha/beta-hydrolase n=1 Tax=Aspergillus affinis TaxID=1070780 RepID=UPI0022FE105D|nr:alpha/beta-hydrolase [Aspergillus affinis]KAI9038256.1 alpha/beta-hydrolase [Aspergillus affinis]
MAFKITEHVIDSQYIREYPHSTATQDAPLKLAIKKYAPIDNPNPLPGDVTIIAAHGTGFAKELYEPLWEDLLARSKQDGYRIRAIWMADAVNQGASGILNEEHLGNDPSWTDHGRDLLHMINHFRADMPQPIVGLGHSTGGAQLVHLSLIHPRLFTTISLLEGYLTDKDVGERGRALLWATLMKPDVWPSREAAIKQLPKFFKQWDKRALARWNQYAYRDLPTAIHPDLPENIDPKNPPVTLTTTKHQELTMYTRANPNRHKELGLPAELDNNKGYGPSPPHDPLFVPDMLGPLYESQLIYCAEPLLAFRLLPHVRPSVLLLYGEASELSKFKLGEKAAVRTGTGFSGSGGQAYNRVKHVLLPKCGHMLPMEKVPETAGVVGPWIGRQLQQWREDQRRLAEGWEGLSVKEKSTIGPEWKATFVKAIKTHPKFIQMKPNHRKSKL